jgi:hypothetical protein
VVRRLERLRLRVYVHIPDADWAVNSGIELWAEGALNLTGGTDDKQIPMLFLWRNYSSHES